MSGDDLGSTDILKRLKVLGVAGPIDALLGCAWGRDIQTEADPGRCPEQAVKMMTIHAPPGVEPAERAFKFCERHFGYAAELTDKHGGSVT